ncbi:MAG: hypothetical protein IJI88_04910 [Atopobiaceae bacterium]|nr:hypothetical protein [Atopobiaceae bacterium]
MAKEAAGIQIDEGIEALLEALAGDRRRQRQDASHRLALVAREDPSKLYGCTDALIDALYRPEAQTRWEVLDALSELVGEKAAKLADAYDGAESSLFDEGSSTVRLSAFRFLTRFGATSAERSDKVWGIVDEAIQCYHGDPEYRDMLACLRDFAQGKISPETRKGLVARIAYDAESGRGYNKTVSEEIIEISGAAEKKPKKASSSKAKKAAEAAE